MSTGSSGPQKGIEIRIGQGKPATTSSGGIQITVQGEGAKTHHEKDNIVYILVDCSQSMGAFSSETSKLPKCNARGCEGLLSPVTGATEHHDSESLSAVVIVIKNGQRLWKAKCEKCGRETTLQPPASKREQARKGALNYATDALAKGYSVGLIGFHTSPKLTCEPTKDISAFEQRMESGLLPGEDTHMAKAIDLAHKKLEGKRGSLAIVVATDGMPNGPGDPEATSEAADRAKKDGIYIYCIGTSDADERFLKALASKGEFGQKVSERGLGQALASAAQMLPGPKSN